MVFSLHSAVAYSRIARQSAASADGFHIEPAIAYSVGVLSQSGIPDISTAVTSFEGRIEYSFDAFSVGLSYLTGVGTGEQMGNKADVKPTDIGLFLGYGLPFDLTLLGSYLVSSKVKLQSSENSSDFSGQGYKFGLKWMGLSPVSVMVDYTKRTYTKYGGSSLTNSIQDTTTSLSLGYPF